VGVILWGLALLSGHALVSMLAIVATLRAIGRVAPEAPDPGAFKTYVAVAAGLTLVLRAAP
jgi:hypothetical protein